MNKRAPTKPILPGATLGVLGSGQLGRMLAVAARRMGYKLHTYSPDQGTPTGQLADREVAAPYEDLDALADFARGVDVISFEFENVPYAATECVAQYVPVRPRGEVLHTAQHRLREKTFLREHGFPTAPWRKVNSLEALHRAVAEIGAPAVLKTAGFGYDGKGQAKLRAPEGAEAAWRAIGETEAVLEGFIDFEMEVSVVAARGLDGEFVHYGVLENQHHNHILDVTIPDAELPPELRERAVEVARGILEQLDVVGVLCVEFFVTRTGELLVNELAPRPHNSGHFTFDASVTSQFEQQLRAACGLPLGSTTLLRPAAMVNLLGDLWNDGEPNWAAALADPDVKLHLYGKAAARPGRKMGHITAFGNDRMDARARALAARARLAG
ncbi:5-(carboxyamino)imidazole ribonucleotide synthase [Alkalilimnicola sp. S0819]|uniref:5-(carboxyamino)imidazole ribonucleotide synthase n=1 Tax=Alkalilimnicola sp. S0819 TaxID=2613922 RepID=UPI001D0105C3|nr:5-(carboxyamino)imidazole ribonucleotide synthase [Alkalilimnicola sp. S0819]